MSKYIPSNTLFNAAQVVPYMTIVAGGDRFKVASVYESNLYELDGHKMYKITSTEGNDYVLRHDEQVRVITSGEWELIRESEFENGDLKFYYDSSFNKYVIRSTVPGVNDAEFGSDYSMASRHFRNTRSYIIENEIQ